MSSRVTVWQVLPLITFKKKLQLLILFAFQTLVWRFVPQVCKVRNKQRNILSYGYYVYGLF